MKNLLTLFGTLAVLWLGTAASLSSTGSPGLPLNKIFATPEGPDVPQADSQLRMNGFRDRLLSLYKHVAHLKESMNEKMELYNGEFDKKLDILQEKVREYQGKVMAEISKD